MMKYNEWKLITESLAGGMTLGLSQLPTVGGLVGARFSEDFDEDDEDGDEDEDLDDEGDDESEDLLGSPDEGPEQTFPPDDSEEMDGLPTPDEEMLGGDEEGDLSAALASAGTPASPSDMTGGAPEGGEDMSFLGDIDPDLLGGEGGSEMPVGAEDPMGGEDPLSAIEDPTGGEEGLGGEPCPDCNPDGAEEMGLDDCPTCSGAGFLDGGDVEAEMDGSPVADKENDMTNLMQQMKAYCDKYMAAESNFNKHVDAASKSAAKPQATKSSGRPESNDFLSSLSHQATGNVWQKFKSGLTEDSLVQPEEPQGPEAGSIGFAPQGRVGSIGGGYTMNDFEDLPVLGESHRWPTLNEWMIKRATRK